MNIALRIGALVLAAGLIVGAVLFRGGRGGTDDPGGPGPRGVQVLVCPIDLGGLCSELGGLDKVAIQLRATDEQATTAVTEPLAEAWLVPAAWADTIDDARSRSRLDPLLRSDVVASSPLVLVVWADRGAVLASTCGVAVEALTWDCIGASAGKRWTDVGGDVRWGDVVPGHGAPDTTIGLQATAAVVAGNLGTGFSLTDLRDPTFTAWFRQVERAVTDFRPAGGSHLRAMVLRGPSVADAAVATEVDVAAFAGRDVVFGELVTVAASPMLVVELVVVGDDEDAVGDMARLLAGDGRPAFASEGWRVDGSPPKGSPLVTTPELATPPSGGALTALRTIWADLVG